MANFIQTNQKVKNQVNECSSNLRVELGALGIIDGDNKRALEVYIDERLFRQRKTFDEYIIDVTNVTLKLTLCDLMIIANNFKVTVLEDCILLGDKH